jgi:hypothetical protein
MFELWALEANGWRCVYRNEQRWKVEHEASRWPKWQVEIMASGDGRSAAQAGGPTVTAGQ